MLEWREEPIGRGWSSGNYNIARYSDFYTLYVYRLGPGPAGADMRWALENMHTFSSLDEAKHYAEVHYLTGA